MGVASRKPGVGVELENFDFTSLKLGHYEKKSQNIPLRLHFAWYN